MPAERNRPKRDGFSLRATLPFQLCLEDFEIRQRSRGSRSGWPGGIQRRDRDASVEACQQVSVARRNRSAHNLPGLWTA
jgi:hypothetical protein